MRIHYPRSREVLRCDFKGLNKPEMIKRRPVIVLSYSPARPHLAIVVPLSTTPPNPPQPWHHQLTRASQWDHRERWVKGDMIYTMSLDRLDWWQVGRDSDGREIFLKNHQIDESDFSATKKAVLSALNITEI